jgi:hypothetical protein
LTTRDQTAATNYRTVGFLIDPRADGDDHHRDPQAVCEDCEMVALTSRALELEQRVRGRATLQVATNGRLQKDLTLECIVFPVKVADEQLGG